MNHLLSTLTGLISKEAFLCHKTLVPTVLRRARILQGVLQAEKSGWGGMDDGMDDLRLVLHALFLSMGSDGMGKSGPNVSGRWVTMGYG